MSRFSLSSPFALFQPIVASDPDATSSSTSSSSAINNSSTSLSLSPATSSQSTSIFSEIQQQQLSNKQQKHAFKFQTNTTTGLKTTIEQTKQISKHLLALQREIKEEEDEIFADINSLINDRSNLYSSSFDAEDDDDFEENGAISGCFITNPLKLKNSPKDQHHTILDSSPQQISSLLHQQQQPITPPSTRASPKTNDSLVQQDEHLEEADQYNLHHDQHENQFQFETLDHQQSENRFQDQHQIDDDEQQQLQAEQSIQEALQQQQQRDIQELTSNLPKPCVFFLEGNCRRSDCKFSHDLSSIICKYWIEGFCFKGELCPFSHSLSSLNGRLGEGNGNDKSLMDGEYRSHLSEKQLNPTFVIESEADFPSLPLDAPAGLNGLLGEAIQFKNLKEGTTTKIMKNQILSSNPAVVFKTTKKKRKKG